MRFIGNVEKDAQVRAVASGALSTGDTVVVNSDGTVSVVAGSDAVTSSPSVFVSGEVVYNKATFDSNSNKVVIAYRNSSSGDNGFAVVGTVSGGSISFGTPVAYNTSASSTNDNAIAFDSNSNKVVIAYQDGGNSNYGTAIVGTVSGTSISFGTEVVFNAANSQEFYMAFDSSSNKIVIGYQDFGNSGYGTAVVGTVSGTSISFGTATVFQSSNMEDGSMAFDSSNNKIVIACGSGTGKAYVGTVSGTSISFGSAVTFESGTAVQDTAAVFDSNSNKIVIPYRDGATTGAPGTAIVGTVSGTSISFGTKVEFNNGYEADFIGATFDSFLNKVVIAYRDRNTPEYGTAVTGTVSGTSISFDTPVVYEEANSAYNTAVFDSASNTVVIAYRDVGDSSYGKSVVFSPASTNLTAENFLGFADSGYADGQSAAINSACTVDRNQTGLTAGQKYYVQTNGALGTTPGDPSVEAGTAISSTEIIVKG